ncbi:MAG: hypothetical protein Q9159_004364 [Coniocarpon cinnabarinum]
MASTAPNDTSASRQYDQKHANNFNGDNNNFIVGDGNHVTIAGAGATPIIQQSMGAAQPPPPPTANANTNTAGTPVVPRLLEARSAGAIPPLDDFRPDDWRRDQYVLGAIRAEQNSEKSE